jgi:hypothetical protein
MTDRRRLDDRRASLSFDLECGGLAYVCTVSRFPDGRLAEVFLSDRKAGSQAGANARDSAVVASLALQHGVQAETIRHALLRDGNDVASSPLGVALDLIAEGES